MRWRIDHYAAQEIQELLVNIWKNFTPLLLLNLRKLICSDVVLWIHSQDLLSRWRSQNFYDLKQVADAGLADK